ncbi:hypothetical protein [Tropicimonas sp. S265A]|uniref:hypothetical protein n=1 Tax=Tropicimonas sp. S265A TaxID=3415134 RepID=UPI003C7CC0A6
MAEPPEPRKVIGTFHKTGSVLWQLICEKAVAEGVFDCWNLTKGPEAPTAEVILSLHAHTTTSLLAEHASPLSPQDRWVVCIRDPRDLVISAAHYHAVTKERWCHVPHKEFAGLTYQEKLNSFGTLSDKLLFEMDNSAGRAIRNMTRMRKELPDDIAHFVKLEHLLEDTGLRAFGDAFAFLGFDPGRIVDLLAIAVECSFFADPSALTRSKHARAGAVAEFTGVFDYSTTRRFEDLFPDSLAVLGYPEDGLSPRVSSQLTGRTDAKGRFWPGRRPQSEYQARIDDLNDRIDALSDRLNKEFRTRQDITRQRNEALETLDRLQHRTASQWIQTLRDRFPGRR